MLDLEKVLTEAGPVIVDKSGVFLIAVFLLKIIYNDLAHLNSHMKENNLILRRIEKLLKK